MYVYWTYLLQSLGDFPSNQVDKSAPGLLEATLKRYQVDSSHGLTSEQVFVRRQQYGPNELCHKASTSEKSNNIFGKLKEEYGDMVGQYLEQFQNPLILLLIGSAAVSLLLGQMENAISIALVPRN